MDIGVARGGTLGARAPPPQGGENFFWAKFTVVSAPHTESAPLRQSKSPFFEEIGEMWTVGEVIWVVLACFLRATTKKRSSTFWRKKSAPLDKILATPMRMDEMQATIVSFH